MPHIFLLTIGIVTAGMVFFRKGFRDLERPLIYCTVIALVLTVIPDMMIPPDERRFGFFDMLLRTTLSAPLLLYLSAMGGFFSPTPQIAGARAALALLAMLICGDRFFPGDFQNTHLAFLDPLLKNYYLLYGSGALGMALLIPLCFLSISRFEKRENGEEKRHSGLGVRLFFFLLIPLLAWGGFEIFRQNPELLVKIERFFLGMGGRRSVRNYGKNPFASSTMYGCGYNYHPLYVAFSRQMVGALPVGIMTKGDNDTPYWPVRDHAVFKEIWGHTSGKYLWVLADLIK